MLWRVRLTMVSNVYATKKTTLPKAVYNTCTQAVKNVTLQDVFSCKPDL